MPSGVYDHSGRCVPIADRFWPKVDKSGDCWIWTACRTKQGYGRVGANGKVHLAHRVAYELTYGKIPENIEIDHRCRNGHLGCVRPDHLRLATHKQNGENVKLRVDSTSGIRGVCWDKNRRRWIAKVAHHGKQLNLGRFLTKEDAEAAVVAKRNELFTHNDQDRVLP